MSGWAPFGVDIVQGEVSLLLSATRRGSRWNNHGRNENQDPLIQGLYQLQDQLNHAPSLASFDVITYIKPFCQIVQSDNTTGPVTGMAIGSLEKFLSYNLIDPTHPSAPSAIESLSEAVTHARFVGTNPASDEVVLMKILQVLRTLLLSPVGRLLTNESVCEIMQSCFRICFEMRLSELLRCFGESTLVDLVQLMFTRLLTFSEDPRDQESSSAMDQTLMTPHQETPPPIESVASDDAPESPADDADGVGGVAEENAESAGDEKTEQEKDKVLTPYGLPCVRELLRFLVSIISTDDGQANSDPLVGIGLNLVTVVLECGSTHICWYSGLAALVQDSLSKYLFQLLKHDSFVLFSRALHCCCLLFRSCRPYLKLQLEVFMNHLMELITIDGSSKTLYDKKELALEAVVQLCCIPHFPAELYVNFDCGLYCSNVFENITKILSKNAFPTQGAILSTHILSLDALLAIANNLETDSHVTLSVGGSGDGCVVKREPSNSTQIPSAGIIFSCQQIKTALPLLLPTPLSRSHDDVVGTSAGDDDSKPASGYQVGVRMEGARGEGLVGRGLGSVPSSKELLKTRQKKKLILAATEQFNKKPKQGVSFLMEQGVLATPLDPSEVADFLRENPGLSKAMIGDYIGNRKHIDILEAFVSKQLLCEVPMVDALRSFLESFRLPGESAIVERVLEMFSSHWLTSNQGPGGLGETFANPDAVHVLSYAIMMLNTDLHSSQVKKKMTLAEFIRNQRKTNNGSNFPESFLMEVYSRIKGEEIIMPDEHSGVVRDNYQWKVLIQRSTNSEEEFTSVTNGEFDQDLFLLSWGPTIAALSYVYDHADDKTIAQKAITGFSKCASVAANFELKEVFDNLIISLCKFTTLLNNHESSSSLYYLLGVNPKVRQSVHTMFSLAHKYGNILREGWNDLLDCLLALFKARLLPQQMVEVFDFLHPEGKISLFRDEAPVRSDSSLLSSLYSYWSSSQESGSSPSSASGLGGGVASGRGLSASEGKARSEAVKCIEDCNPKLLFTESKFLRSDALSELVKALVFASRGPDQHQSLGTHFDEDASVFFMELLITVAIENKDRVNLFWKDLSSHLSRIISAASENRFLLERGVVSVLHLALRLLGRGDFLILEALSSLHTLLSLPPPTTPTVGTLYCQMAHGITELVHTHATTLTSAQHWAAVFTVLEFSGTGISTMGGVAPNSFDSLESVVLPVHEPQAFFKVCECLSFIVRSDHLTTSENFSACVQCSRHFTEIASSKAALDYDQLHTQPAKSPGSRREKASSPTRTERLPHQSGGNLAGKSRDSNTTYASSLLQLLDLLDALYSKVGQIYDAKTLASLTCRTESCADQDTGESCDSGQGGYCPDVDAAGVVPASTGHRDGGCGLMWNLAWCPLLQGMARMCCDSRRSVRQTSITYLQRALLSHDLHDLTGQDWHACFTEVFFPMLSRLLEDIPTGDRLNLEETRVRASNLLCKVFLQHLPSLAQAKDSFSKLWMNILQFMENFLLLEHSDLLYEAIPESLKNMLLVMTTQGIFQLALSSPRSSEPGGSGGADQLWVTTWNRIEQFLPNFLSELFPNEKPPSSGGSGTPEVGGADVVAVQQELSSSEEKGHEELSGSPSGPSPCHTPQSSPDPSGSPAISSSSGTELNSSDSTFPASSPAFPVTLHPPLPTLAQQRTPSTSPVHMSHAQNQLNSESGHPTNGSDLVPTIDPKPGTAVPSQSPGQEIQVPVLGPILSPPAPPYSNDADLEPNGSGIKQMPIQLSSLYSL